MDLTPGHYNSSDTEYILVTGFITFSLDSCHMIKKVSIFF